MAEEKELTDSQLLDVARQLEQELRFKQNAAAGLRQYVRVKQDLKSKKQDLADVGAEIAKQKKELDKIKATAALKVQDLGTEFDAKKAEREMDLKNFASNHDQAMEKLKQEAASRKAENDLAVENAQNAMKALTVEHSKKMKALKAQEDEKVARLEALDRTYTDLKASLDQLKAQHGLGV